MRTVSPLLTDPLILPLVEMSRRPAILALWSLDARLGVIAATGREPALRQIRMRWWAESVQSLATAHLLPAEPVLMALHAHAPALLNHSALAGYLDTWEAITLDADDHDAIVARGEGLFALTEALLDPEAGELTGHAGRAGGCWSLVDRAIATTDQSHATTLYAAARGLRRYDVTMRRSRALLVIDRLAHRIAHSDGTRHPRSEQWAIFRIGLFGR